MQFHHLAKVLPGPQVLAFLVRLTSEVPRELLHECPRSYSQTPDYFEAANKAEKVKKTFNIYIYIYMLFKDIYCLILGRKYLWIQFYCLFVS